MKITKLIKYLIILLFKYGNREIDIITESHFSDEQLKDINEYKAIQVEQCLEGIAYSSREKRIKLLPQGF